MELKLRDVCLEIRKRYSTELEKRVPEEIEKLPQEYVKNYYSFIMSDYDITEIATMIPTLDPCLKDYSATNMLRIGRALILEVLELLGIVLLENDVRHRHPARLIDELRQTFLIETHERYREDGAHGISLHGVAYARNQVDHSCCAAQLGHLIMSVAVNEARGPREVLVFDVRCRERHFDTARLH